MIQAECWDSELVSKKQEWRAVGEFPGRCIREEDSTQSKNTVEGTIKEIKDHSPSSHSLVFMQSTNCNEQMRKLLQVRSNLQQTTPMLGLLKKEGVRVSLGSRSFWLCFSPLLERLTSLDLGHLH